MSTFIILTLISLVILAMGFLGIHLPLITIRKIKAGHHWTDAAEDHGFPRFKDDPEVAYRLIKKQLQPSINLKRFRKLIPGDAGEHLVRIRLIRRKVSV